VDWVLAGGGGAAVLMLGGGYVVGRDHEQDAGDCGRGALFGIW
jgi:hypothetical protein